MKFLRVIDTILARLVNITLVGLFVVMMGIAVVQVCLRYFFNGGVIWGDVAARTLVLWVGFLGAAIATRESKHFHIDVLTRFLKKRHQLWLQVFSNLFALIVCFFLTRASLTFLDIEGQSKTFLDLPVFIVELIIPVGFCLMTVQFGLRMVFNIVEGSDTASSLENKETA